MRPGDDVIIRTALLDAVLDDDVVGVSAASGINTVCAGADEDMIIFNPISRPINGNANRRIIASRAAGNDDIAIETKTDNIIIGRATGNGAGRERLGAIDGNTSVTFFKRAVMHG